MPSTSAKQHRFMAAVAHSPSFAKKVGVSQSVGKDFTAADKGRKFSKGGQAKVGKQNTGHGKMDMPFRSLQKFSGMETGGLTMRPKKDIARDQQAMAPYARGGGIESRGKTKGTMVKMAGGGFVRSADGIAQRGKTKGTKVKMKKGGMC